MSATRRVLVVGAGISGLTAAYRLKHAGFDVTVLEARDDVGGRAHTVVKQGYTIDTGAGAIFESYHAYWALARELGLDREIVKSSQQIGVIRDRKIHYLNSSNIYLSGIRTGLLSWGAKLRLLLAYYDVVMAKRRGHLTYNDLTRAAALDWETARQYAERRLGSELAEYFAEPIVRGMMLYDSDKVSKVELLHGLNNIFDVTTYGLKGGVKRFSSVLAQHVDVRLGAPVESVRKVAGGVEVTWRENGHSRSEVAAGCVLACPLPVAARIHSEHAPLHALDRELQYGQCITVALGTRVRPHSNAYILEVPKAESEDVCFAFLEHNKGTPATPPGCGLVTLYLEGDVSTALMEASDEAIVARVLPFVQQVMPEIGDSVEMTHVTRWKEALPINKVGAYQRVADFNRALSPQDPVQIACDYMMAAVGQTIAVECGNAAAANLIAAQSSRI